VKWARWPTRIRLYLAPALTNNQDNQLLRAVQKSGRNWKAIRDQHFIGRSRNDVKNRYTILGRRGSPTTLATLAKRNALHIESDEDGDQDRFMDDAEEDDEEEEDEDDGDEDDGDDDSNDNNNTNNHYEGDSFKACSGMEDEGVGQDPMGLDQFLTPFLSFGCSARTAATTPTENTFSLPFSMNDDMHLDTDHFEHNFPFETTPDQFDLMAMPHIEPTASSALDSLSSALSSVAEDSFLLEPPQQTQPLKMSTYKRVTLVLEDYEKGLMDQLLQIVSTSQGKSQIEIMP
jgi:hypothetical protein